MAENKIILPGQTGDVQDIERPQSGLYVPPHVAAQREAENQRREEQAARNLMIGKAQSQLTSLAGNVQTGQPVSQQVRKEAGWLMRVATGEGNRKVRRLHQRRLGLLPSQQRGVVLPQLPTPAEPTPAEPTPGERSPA